MNNLIPTLLMRQFRNRDCTKSFFVFLDIFLQKQINNFSINRISDDAGLYLDFVPRRSQESQVNDEFPNSIRIGGIVTPWEKHLTVSGDVEKVDGLPLRVYSGVEWVFRELAMFRMGWYRDRLTAGAGLRLSVAGKPVQMDYAYAPDPVAPGPTHIFSWSSPQFDH